MWGEGPSPSLCMWIFNCCSNSCWKYYPIPFEGSGPLRWALSKQKYIFLVSEVCSTGLTCLSLHQYHNVLISVACTKFWNLIVWGFQICSFFQNCLSSSRFFVFHIHFRISLSISTKMPLGILVRIDFNLKINY